MFFGVTKLFMSPDGNLRRMVYLFLKEVAESTDSGEVIIVVQSLCKVRAGAMAAARRGRGWSCMRRCARLRVCVRALTRVLLRVRRPHGCPPPRCRRT